MSDTLTPLEQEIVRCTLSRFTCQQVAHQLRLSEGTVQAHLRSIYSKLGVTSPLELLLCVYSGAVKVTDEKVAAA